MAALLQKKALLHRAEEGEQAGGHGKRIPEAGAKGGSKRGLGVQRPAANMVARAAATGPTR
jgi:hypothetical protein